jgi:hypothetical protein
MDWQSVAKPSNDGSEAINPFVTLRVPIHHHGGSGSRSTHRATPIASPPPHRHKAVETRPSRPGGRCTAARLMGRLEDRRPSPLNINGRLWACLRLQKAKPEVER